MRSIFTAPNFRRTSLLLMGIAVGLLFSPGAHDSLPVMAIASVLCFVSVGLVSRYGLPS